MIKRILVVLGVTSLVAGISYFLYEQYKIISAWSFSVVGASVTGYNSEQITLNVKLKIINISSVEALISKLSANVMVNGQFVGALSQPDVMSIPANGYNILNLNVIIQNQQFLTQLLSFASTGNPINLEVAGTVFVQSGIGLTIPFDETSTYTLADIIS